MPDLHINYLLAGAIAIVIYYVGLYLKAHSKFLRDYYIPAPVVGGLVFALINLLLHESHTVNLIFDDTLGKFFMSLFFTSVGYGARFSFVKSGSNKLLKLAVLCGFCILCQNFIAISLTKAFHLPALLGITAGSVPMVGGHGSAGVFGPMLVELGIRGALTSAIAMATFGLIMGGLLGGPLAGYLVRKHKLESSLLEVKTDQFNDNDDMESMGHNFTTTVSQMMKAMAMLLFAMGIGSIVADIGRHFHIMLPVYLGSVLVACLIRNLSGDDPESSLFVPMQEIRVLAEMGLNIFLAMALMDLKLWLLLGMAGPLCAIALAQLLFMAFFAGVVVFRVMGKDYEAAVTAAAVSGFGLGALPTGIANMNAITTKFGPAPMIYLLVPLASSLADCMNGCTAILLINLLK